MNKHTEKEPPQDTNVWERVHGHAPAAFGTSGFLEQIPLPASKVELVARKKALNSPLDWLANPCWLFNNDSLLLQVSPWILGK